MKHLPQEFNEKKTCFLAPVVEITYFSAEDDVITDSAIELPGDEFENP